MNPGLATAPLAAAAEANRVMRGVQRLSHKTPVVMLFLVAVQNRSKGRYLVEKGGVLDLRDEPWPTWLLVFRRRELEERQVWDILVKRKAEVGAAVKMLDFEGLLMILINL